MESVIDLVCGMELHPSKAPLDGQHNGVTYYFCSLECKRRFDAHPEIYIQNNAQAKSPA